MLGILDDQGRWERSACILVAISRNMVVPSFASRDNCSIVSPPRLCPVQVPKLPSNNGMDSNRLMPKKVASLALPCLANKRLRTPRALASRGPPSCPLTFGAQALLTAWCIKEGGRAGKCSGPGNQCCSRYVRRAMHVHPGSVTDTLDTALGLLVFAFRRFRASSK